MQAIPKSNLERFIEAPGPRAGRDGRFVHTRIGLALIAEAERAYVTRDDQALTKVAGIMCRQRMPSDIRTIGQFYSGLALLRRGGLGECTSKLRSVAEAGPSVYRAKAYLALGQVSRILGDSAGALDMYGAAEGISRGVDLRSYWQAQKMKAVITSELGDHVGALRQLDRIAPLAKVAAKAYPLIAFDQLNSVALELANNHGQAEAIAIAESMGSWPVLGLYPEFVDTRRSLLKLRHLKSRLFLPGDAVSGDNVIMAAPRIDRLPEPIPGKLLRFERPAKQELADDRLTIMLGKGPNPLVDGTISEKDVKRLLRFVGTLKVF